MAIRSAGDEWPVSAETGDLVKLKALVKKAAFRPDASKPQEALVAGAVHNQVEAMEILLDWGVPVESKDGEGRLVLHSAAEAGSAEAVALLCKRGADIEKLDSKGMPATLIAIRGNKMAVVKELLRAGAILPKGEIAPGLAAIAREVQLEKLANELKEISQRPEVTLAELAEADVGVWECQNEHMRLLRLREEQRAGRQLFSFEDRIKAEREVAERMANAESQHVGTIAERRVELQALQTDVREILKEIPGFTSSLEVVRAEDDVLKAELRERREELAAVNAEIDERDRRSKGEQEAFEEAQKRWKGFEAEVAEQRSYNEAEAAELEAAQLELRGWRRDREAAAKLTAQAHKLLGN